MKQAILSSLPQNYPWREHILCFDSIGSTNTAAKELAAQGAAHGTALVANRQTGGRGRMGRSFHSPSGKGIYLTLLLRPQCHASELMHLTCATAVAACDAVESVCGIRPGIKWTNDLVIGTHKLGGILTELVLDPHGNAAAAIIGIGINCCHSREDFPRELQDTAVSLYQATGKNANRNALTAALLAQLEEMSRRLLTHREPLLERYRADCITLGKEVSILWPDRVAHGIARNIGQDGSLLVEFADGHLETVNSGEVSIRGMYGYI